MHREAVIPPSRVANIAANGATRRKPFSRRWIRIFWEGHTQRVLSFVFLFVSISPLPLYLLPKTPENRLGSSGKISLLAWALGLYLSLFQFLEASKIRERLLFSLEETDLLSLDILFYFTSAFDLSWRVGIFLERQYWFKKQHKKAMYHTRYRRKLKP